MAIPGDILGFVAWQLWTSYGLMEWQGLSSGTALSPLWPHGLQDRVAEGPSGHYTAQSTPALARIPDPQPPAGTRILLCLKPCSPGHLRAMP